MFERFLWKLGLVRTERMEQNREDIREHLANIVRNAMKDRDAEHAENIARLSKRVHELEQRGEKVAAVIDANGIVIAGALSAEEWEHARVAINTERIKRAADPDNVVLIPPNLVWWKGDLTLTEKGA